MIAVALLAVALIVSVNMMSCKGKPSTEGLTDEGKIETLSRMIDKSPKNAALYFERAEAYVSLEKWNDAIKDLEKATSLDQKHKEYYKLLGDTYFRIGDVEHSYKAMEKVVELDENDVEGYMKLGEIAFYSKDYDRAMEHLNMVTAKMPDNQAALFMKGFIYKETGDTTNAAFYFRKVIDQYPEYEPAYEELGFMYANHGSDLAVEYLNTAISLEPTNTQAMYGLAMYFQDKKRVDEAEELYKKITEINPKAEDAWHNLGYIELFHYGDYDNAIEYFNRAIEIDDKFIEALTNRGWAYAMKGDKTNARISYNSALAIDPTYQPALEGLGEL